MTCLSVTGLNVVPIMHLNLVAYILPPTCTFLACSLFKLSLLPSVAVLLSATSLATNSPRNPPSICAETASFGPTSEYAPLSVAVL